MQMCHEPRNTHFSHIFFEHGYLTYQSTYLFDKSQNVNIELSFCFIGCRRRDFEKEPIKNNKIYVFFVIK